MIFKRFLLLLGGECSMGLARPPPAIRRFAPRLGALLFAMLPLAFGDSPTYGAGANGYERHPAQF
ncbi:MAG TPA: hypothetical protein VMJ14_13730 [Burkholderiales bacterium]|nr:hypothetical protein [Burkholderiales bacterium]